MNIITQIVGSFSTMRKKKLKTEPSGNIYHVNSLKKCRVIDILVICGSTGTIAYLQVNIEKWLETYRTVALCYILKLNMKHKISPSEPEHMLIAAIDREPNTWMLR